MSLVDNNLVMSHVLTCVETLLFCWHLIKSVVQWCFYLDVSAICASNQKMVSNADFYLFYFMLIEFLYWN